MISPKPLPPPATLSLWPEGQLLAVTFSFDDGRKQDIQLAALLNGYQLKSTLNIHTVETGINPKYLSPQDLGDPVFRHHEIALHSHTHPFLTSLPDTAVLEEIRENRLRLESYTDAIVRGFAYPFGDFDQRITRLCAAAGASYARTVDSTRSFDAPRPGADWMKWNPTCHENELTPAMVADFLDVKMWHRLPRLLFLWGHSWELDGDSGAGWDRMDRLCRQLAPYLGTQIWAATNLEIYDYLSAQAALQFSADGRKVRNPGRSDCWLSFRDIAVKVPPGETLSLH